MSRKEFNEYVTEITNDFENCKNAILEENDFDIKQEIVDDFMMNTTHIHDDEELSKTEYFVIRAMRDSFYNVLVFLLNN
jgi:hypothetical protein